MAISRSSTRTHGIAKEPLGFPAARDELLRLMRRHQYATLATASPTGQPEAVPLRYAVTDDLEVVMGTLSTSRKIRNLRRSRKVALLVWDYEQSIQIEGLFDEPAGTDLERLRLHFGRDFPREAAIRATRPSHLFFRIRPLWARIADF